MKQTVKTQQETGSIDTRVQTLENTIERFAGALENLTKIIVNVQITQQGQRFASVPLGTDEDVFNADTKQMRKMQGQQKTAPKRESLPQSLKDASFDVVLAHTADTIRHNMKAKIWNEKIIDQQKIGRVNVPDYRVWLRTSEHRTFKVSYLDAGYTLPQAVELLADAIGY